MTFREIMTYLMALVIDQANYSQQGHEELCEGGMHSKINRKGFQRYFDRYIFTIILIDWCKLPLESWDKVAMCIGLSSDPILLNRLDIIE